MCARRIPVAIVRVEQRAYRQPSAISLVGGLHLHLRHVLWQGLKPLPDFLLLEPTGKAKHNQIVTSVESMLSLHERLALANTAHDKAIVQRQIDATDRQIDRLVYELYGLTDEEIAIVEVSAAPSTSSGMR